MSDDESDHSGFRPPKSALDDFHHVDQLWFEDGTLILGAGNSLFRVYGGLLAKRSPVFHDMLGIPQPEFAEVVDGCPVVYLPDNERDLNCFLSALFDYEFFGAVPAKTTSDIVAWILRLSTKYEVTSLRKRALEHLASAFPFTPAEFPGSPSWDIPAQEWIRVVLFAREMAIDWILPVAFYRMVEKSTPAQLLNGIDVDGVHMELTSADKLTSIEQLLAISKFGCAEVTYCFWDHLLNPVCWNSSSQAICFKGKLESRKKVEERRTQNIFPLDLWMPVDWDTLRGCGPCKSAMRTAHQNALSAFWNGLPPRFGLAGWDVLKELKDADLV
ncbi:hypothetical protein B0H19DRAFT_1184114 [Mycena capillaripes]|nr:hypothetical protein B0H19DRAFT_1184114 [Mycena capillaripes]